MPYGVDNALVKAAKVVARLADYRPAPYVDALWEGFVASLALDPELKAALIDPARVDDAIARLPASLARMAWSSTHTTFSTNQCRGGVKTNVIPNVVEVEVDIRTVPGDSDDEVRESLTAALRRDYRVLRAATGEAAFQMMQKEDVDLMLLEVHLRGISGFEVLM